MVVCLNPKAVIAAGKCILAVVVAALFPAMLRGGTLRERCKGLDWIDASSFKTVILRHYPELAATGLGNIKNAFEPWDTGEQLDPARHPPCGWDKSFKGYP